MAENIPTPPGGIPPRPSEAAKVQPKKETVRINLPPKPTASPTIKLPTLPTGGAPAAAGAAAMPPGAAPRPAGAPMGAPGAPRPMASAGAPAKPAAAPASRLAGAAPAATPAAPVKRAPAPRAAASSTLSGVDKGLAITAAVVSVIALSSVVYLGWMVYQPL
ncbi:MAG: hypothetical protein H0X66_11715 [Verrucomicrobia bacterium]|nr:hypothetical protein [Verrucomicrobiota bacterium]